MARTDWPRISRVCKQKMKSIDDRVAVGGNIKYSLSIVGTVYAKMEIFLSDYGNLVG